MDLAAVCHNSISFERLDPLYKSLVGDLARDASDYRVDATFIPFECKQSLWKVMARNRIQIMPELFEKMELDDSLEMWAVSRHEGAQKMRFVLAIGKIMRCSSYSLDDLATIPWNELFQRQDRYNLQIVEGVHKALKTRTSQFNVTGWHDVWESQSNEKRVFQVAVTQLTPFISPDGKEGVFALVKSRPRSESLLRSAPDSRAAGDTTPPSFQN